MPHPPRFPRLRYMHHVIPHCLMILYERFQLPHRISMTGFSRSSHQKIGGGDGETVQASRSCLHNRCRGDIDDVITRIEGYGNSLSEFRVRNEP